MKGLLFCAGVFLAPQAWADAVPFTLKELTEAAQIATDDLQQLEPTLSQDVFGYTVSRTDHGAEVRFFYKDSEGNTKRISFGCHKHDDIFECHRE